MRRSILFLAMALGGVSLLSDTIAAAPARKAAPLARDWTRTVVATPQGGYRMGNPVARVKLVEYGSLSCGHCAAFSRQGGTPLRALVKSGRVSWEFRPYLLFPTDPGISMLLRCGGPASFFQRVDQLYADQGAWMGKLQAMTDEMQMRLESMSPVARSAALTRAAGLDQFFRIRGMPEGRINACLADNRSLQELVAITERGNAEGVTGTPTFFINGAMAHATTWSALEPLIRRAGG